MDTCTVCGHSYTEVLPNYLSKCTFYPSHVVIEVTTDNTIYSEPRATASGNQSVALEKATVGTQYVTYGIYQNTGGNIWYQVKTADGETGYIYAARVKYVEKQYDDIKMSGAAVPNGHVKGKDFTLTGTITADYNYIHKVNFTVYSGFGTSGTKVITASDSITDNKYVLKGSTLDSTVSFKDLATGNYTLVISASYKTYIHDTNQTVKTVASGRTLKKAYFVVVSSAVDQATCSHKNTETVLTAATCTKAGSSVTACSKCGKVTTNTLPAAHTYGSYTVTKAATCTADGIKSRTCSACGDVNTAAIAAAGHKYADGTCTACGAADPNYSDPVTVPTLAAKGFSLSFEDEILVNFYYTVENGEDITGQGMLVFYADPGAADIAKADAVYGSSYVASSDHYISTTASIAAKEMGDNRYYCAYAKLSDGTYAYSPLYQYSPKKYATNILAKASSSAEMKALCVAMLNYGAAAQNYFGYRTDDLMNASLTAEQQALVVGYDASLFNGSVAADASKTGNFPKTSTGFSGRSASVSFDGAFSINFYFTPDAAVEGSMKLYVWTPNDYAAAGTLTTANASAVVTMALQSNGSYWGKAEGIAAKNIDDTYYVAGVYTDAEGNSYCTGVIAYSLSSYCMKQANGNMGQLAQATAMYGCYAKAYFAAK